MSDTFCYCMWLFQVVIECSLPVNPGGDWVYSYSYSCWSLSVFFSYSRCWLSAVFQLVIECNLPGIPGGDWMQSSSYSRCWLSAVFQVVIECSLPGGDWVQSFRWWLSAVFQFFQVVIKCSLPGIPGGDWLQSNSYSSFRQELYRRTHSFDRQTNPRFFTIDFNQGLSARKFNKILCNWV